MSRTLAITLILSLAASIADAQSVETLVDDLNYPWDIETDGDAIYVTEKAGTLGIYANGAFVRRPVETSVPVLDDRGGGLMGLALYPDFAASGRVVLYQHYGTAEKRWNRVIEAARDGNVWRETRVLIDNIPGHPLYNGGRVAFGPDGMLYITTGWTENRERPQDLESLAGKILRLTPDGSVPDDNPYPDSPVWSLGHRNPQGIAWDDTGRLYAAEHGQSGNDEFNLIEAGANYGWPLIEGDETREGLRGPIAHSGSRTWAPSGLAWDGRRLLLAGLKAGGIISLVPGSNEATLAFPIEDRMRDVLLVDGTIHAITTNRSPRRNGTSSDRLVRFVPRD